MAWFGTRLSKTVFVIPIHVGIDAMYIWIFLELAYNRLINDNPLLSASLANKVLKILETMSTVVSGSGSHKMYLVSIGRFEALLIVSAASSVWAGSVNTISLSPSLKSAPIVWVSVTCSKRALSPGLNALPNIILPFLLNRFFVTATLPPKS